MLAGEGIKCRGCDILLEFVNADMPHVIRLTDWESFERRMAISCITLLVAPTGVVNGW